MQEPFPIPLYRFKVGSFLSTYLLISLSMNLSWLYCCRKLGIERTIRLINAHATGKVLENFVDVCVCTSFVKVAIAARGLAPYDTIRYDRRVSRISNLY